MQETPSRTLLRAIIMLAIAVLVLAVLMTVSIVRLVDQAATQQQQHRLLQTLRKIEEAQQLALVEGCQRLQILRVQDNQSHLGDFEVFSFVARMRLSHQFHHKIQAAVRDKTWTPRTNCRQAVNKNGVKYRPPQPIPFVRRLPPPSALP